MSIVRLQVIKVYEVDVPEGTEDPIAYAYGMPTTTIAAEGSLVDVSTDHAEIVEEDEEDEEEETFERYFVIPPTVQATHDSLYILAGTNDEGTWDEIYQNDWYMEVTSASSSEAILKEATDRAIQTNDLGCV